MKRIANGLSGAVYEVFVQSFSDSNNDGIGDLPGLTSKLDYLVELGVEALWLMPIHPSPSYHKYDVTDYYNVHPDYGTLEDFRELIRQAHHRGLKIIIDLVINHCSRLHPWFLSALNPESPYRDYFIWSLPEEIKQRDGFQKKATADSDNVVLWNKVNGQEELYYSYFWQGMPDLNFDNPKVRDEAFNIAQYWLEIGVDGFRVDAAKHIYPEDREHDNHAFWKEFKHKICSIKPEAYLVGEVWSDLKKQVPYATGFSSMFNFDLAYSIMETVKRGKLVAASTKGKAWKIAGKQSPITLYKESERAFSKKNADFTPSTFLTNHDQVRVLSFLNGHYQKARLAASILLTFPGTPYIYYGEELGMYGEKPDEWIRAPFPWSDQKTTETTTWLKNRFNDTSSILPFSQQKTKSDSMFRHYQRLLSFRKSSDTIQYGTIEEMNFEDEKILGFFRTLKDESLLVIHNLGGRIRRLYLPDNFTLPIWQSDFKKIKIQKELLTLSPYQSIVLSQYKQPQQ